MLAKKLIKERNERLQVEEIVIVENEEEEEQRRLKVAVMCKLSSNKNSKLLAQVVALAVRCKL